MTPTIGLDRVPAPVRPGRSKLAPAALALALLAVLAVTGRSGDLTPQDLVTRFVTAMDRGDAQDVAELLHEDPTIVTWLPVLPSSPNASTMTLLDVGRAERVVVATAHPVADYQAFHQGVGSRTEVTGCETRAPRSGQQALLYDSWVDCYYAAGNEVAAIVSGGRGTQRGRIGFGITDQRVRAVLVHGDPNPGTEIRAFQRWIWIEHPDEFARWLRGRFQDPVLSGESATAIGSLARAYAVAAIG